MRKFPHFKKAVDDAQIILTRRSLKRNRIDYYILVPTQRRQMLEELANFFASNEGDAFDFLDESVSQFRELLVKADYDSDERVFLIDVEHAERSFFLLAQAAQRLKGYSTR